METSAWSLESSAVSAQLKRFIAEKCAQVRAETRAPGHEMGAVSKSFFAAAERGAWPEISKYLTAMRQAARCEKTDNPCSWVVYPVEWAAVNEIGGALEELAGGEEQYTVVLAQDIIKSIPSGSIYFGGTDCGRFLVTALSNSQVNGDPFFTVTQNALADSRSYLRYVRGMYGGRIYIPTEEDVTRAFNEYQADALRRRSEGKLLPGEFVEEAGGITEVRGQITVMAINGLLSKLMFDKNSDREFYVEESFPLNWMYPHLAPHGLILKINREPLLELSNEIIQHDSTFWTEYIRPLIGDWLSFQTPLSEVVSFVERVHLRGDQFTGDRRTILNERTQRNFSKLRSTIGGVYAWRGCHSNCTVEKERMFRAADFAFRQALALGPAIPEVVFRFITLLLGQQRLDEGILVAEAAFHLEQKAELMPRTPGLDAEDFSHKRIVRSMDDPTRMITQLGHLLEQLRRMKKAKFGQSGVG